MGVVAGRWGSHLRVNSEGYHASQARECGHGNGYEGVDGARHYARLLGVAAGLQDRGYLVSGREDVEVPLVDALHYLQSLEVGYVGEG